WDDPFPRPLQEDLARLINLPDDYQVASDPDPIVAPPLYGTWHALTKRVLKGADGTPLLPNDNWIHRLNLDPRFRVPAGFGTRVIQDQQEKFMDAAWEQIGEVLEAQRRIRFGQLGVLVSDIWYDRHLAPVLGVSQQKTLLMMAPLNKRIMTSPTTLHQVLSESLMQPAMTSAALRRVIRPRGRLIRSLPFTNSVTPDQLLARVARGEVSASPPKVTPPGIPTLNGAAAHLAPSDAPPAVVDLLRRFPLLPIYLWIVAIVLALVGVVLFGPALGIVIAAAVLGAAWYVAGLLTRWATALEGSDALREENMTPQAVDALPGVSNFEITEPGSAFSPATGADSATAQRFKRALRDAFDVVQASTRAGARPV